MDVIAEMKNHRRSRVWIQPRKVKKKTHSEIVVREKESSVLPELKQVPGCLEEPSQGAEGGRNQRGNVILMSPVHFYIQCKNQSLSLLNALKLTFQCLVLQKGDS